MMKIREEEIENQRKKLEKEKNDKEEEIKQKEQAKSLQEADPELDKLKEEQAQK